MRRLTTTSRCARSLCRRWAATAATKSSAVSARMISPPDRSPEDAGGPFSSPVLAESGFSDHPGPNHRTTVRMIRQYAQRPAVSQTLQQLRSFGERPSPAKMLDNARFLYQELPVRFSKRVTELDSLPYGLSDYAPIREIRTSYVNSFKDIVSQRCPQTPEEDDGFCVLLERIIQRHKNVVLMAKAIMMLRDQLGESIVDCPFLQGFLDRFYMSRVGHRVLMQQHIALHHPADGFIGIIEQTSPRAVLDAAIGDCLRLCESTYGYAPSVTVDGDEALTFSYVPSHLHYMLLELLKNSMRAVVESNPTATSEDDLPPIEIVVAHKEDCDVTIRVSDRGGGIPPRELPRIFNYLYTTAEKPDDSEMYHLSTGWTATSIMAGLGYGLPLCRLYARYFGGELEISSIPGHGTDSYLYLCTIGDTTEPLPL